MAHDPAHLKSVLAWDDLRLVLAIGEQASLSRAAAALGISHPTLSRRLRDAEHRLGCRLVERTPQLCRLTPAGEEARVLASQIATDIAELERRIAGRDISPNGTVRVTAPDAVAEYLLSGVLAKVGQNNSDVTLELLVSNQVLSLAGRDADIAVRVSDAPAPTLKGRRVTTVGMAIYGTPQVVEEASETDSSPWIGFEAGLACSGPGKWIEREIPPERIRFRANTLPAAAKAVSQGVGLCMIPCFIGETTEGLVRVGEPVAELDTGLWILVHPDVADVPRIKTIRGALTQELAALSPVITGR